MIIVNTLQTYFTYEQILVGPLDNLVVTFMRSLYYNNNMTKIVLLIHFDGLSHGYATAYLNQQCTINPLYSSSCGGYANILYTTMGLDPLYDLKLNGIFGQYNVKRILCMLIITCQDMTLLISINSAYLIHSMTSVTDM